MTIDNLPAPDISGALDALRAAIREVPDRELLYFAEMVDGMATGARDGGAARSADVFAALARLASEIMGERLHDFHHIERELADLDVREPKRWRDEDNQAD